jgi:hypothetical protein
MFEMISKGFNVLKAGESLQNAETWKSAQLLGNALTTILIFVVTFIPAKYGISVDMVPQLVAGIVSFAGVANMYLTKATTTKAVTLNPFKVVPDTGTAGSIQPIAKDNSLGENGQLAEQTNLSSVNASPDIGGMQPNRAEVPARPISPLTGEPS